MMSHKEMILNEPRIKGFFELLSLKPEFIDQFYEGILGELDDIEYEYKKAMFIGACMALVTLYEKTKSIKQIEKSESFH